MFSSTVGRLHCKKTSNEMILMLLRAACIVARAAPLFTNTEREFANIWDFEMEKLTFEETFLPYALNTGPLLCDEEERDSTVTSKPCPSSVNKEWYIGEKAGLCKVSSALRFPHTLLRSQRGSECYISHSSYILTW